MSKNFPLEEFQITSFFFPPNNPGSQNQPAIDAEDLENLKMRSYDSGYNAGWEDAAEAQAKDQSHIGVELAKNLQDLGFTFHEARIQVMKSLEPLLMEIVIKVLPEIVSKTVAQTAVEELLLFAEAVIDAPIEIVVAPTNLPALDTLLNATTTVPAKLVKEPTLGPGQVILRAGQSEKHINLDQAIEKIANAIRSIYQINEKEYRHA